MASAGSLIRTLLLCSPLIGLPALASAELFISEYVEGSSNNKAIEIHNPGNAAVDLAAGAYRLQYFFNGNPSAGLTIDLTGSVAAGDVYVIAQSSADAAILAQADQTDGFGWFNGDDAIELQKNSVIIDSIGQVGFDPGSEWGSDLTSTADNTLRRKATICFGDTDSSDVFNPATEWDGFATNTFAGLGAHSATCAPRINEFVADHTGTDTHEFIEIIGLPSTDLSTHTVLHVEGDGTGDGTIDSAYTVGTTDANGFWTTGFLANGLENGSISLLLVQSFSGSVGNDLDTDNDGTLDSTPWAELVDDVAVDDGGADDRHYSTTVLAANYDGQAFAPGGASRIPDALDTGATGDWVRNDFDGAGLPGFAGTLAPGEALNTPGTFNALTPPLPPFACGNEVTLISAVQGDGAGSPLAGETVDIEAIVAAVFQGAGTLGGLFVQEEDTDADANPQTSEGLFVFTSQPAAVGDQVRVRGVATEFFDLTELSPVLDLEICSSGNPLPAATTIALPKASEVAFEPLENMRVTLPDDLVVNDVFTLWRFGEFTVSSVRRPSPTQVASPGAPALAQAASNALDQLIVDDGRTPQNLVVSHTGQDDVNPFAADNPLRNGQTISGLAGMMHYALGVYRLQPTAPFINDETANPRTAAPNPVGGTLTVASFNVLNYFATLDGSGPICGPALDQDCRGADSAGELTRQTDKLVAALAAIDAGVVGLIELENDAGNALATLVDALNAAMGAGTYDYIDTGTIGSDAIKQGLIYKPASVTPEGDFALLTSAVDARFNDALNRPALAQTFRANDNLALFTVALNHLKSKGSDCNALGDPDIGDGQGNCNLTRASAAAALADWLNGDPTGTGAGNTLILGDLNSYPMEDPLATLEGAGFTNLAAAFEGGGSYSFSFNGEAGSLDYALGNAALTAQATGATSWHINADEAIALDYNEEFGKSAQYYLPDPNRASDHDPIIVGLDLNPPAMVTVSTTEPGVEAEVSISGGVAELQHRPAAGADERHRRGWARQLRRQRLRPGRARLQRQRSAGGRLFPRPCRQLRRDRHHQRHGCVHLPRRRRRALELRHHQHARRGDRDRQQNLDHRGRRHGASRGRLRDAVLQRPRWRGGIRLDQPGSSGRVRGVAGPRGRDLPRRGAAAGRRRNRCQRLRPAPMSNAPSSTPATSKAYRRWPRPDSACLPCCCSVSASSACTALPEGAGKSSASQRRAELPQLGLDAGGVLTAHADQRFLSGTHDFELGIDKLVVGFRLDHAHRAGYLGCRQQVVHDLQQAGGEIAFGITQLGISLLQQLGVMQVFGREAFSVDGFKQRDVGLVAFVVHRVERVLLQRVALVVRQRRRRIDVDVRLEGRSRRFQRQQLAGHLARGQRIDGGDEPGQDALLDQQVCVRRPERQLIRRFEHRGIAVLQRRQGRPGRLRRQRVVAFARRVLARLGGRLGAERLARFGDSDHRRWDRLLPHPRYEVPGGDGDCDQDQHNQDSFHGDQVLAVR
jgi:hypothetical protein